MSSPKPVITREAIAERVAQLGRRIDDDYADVDNLVMIGVLKGAFVFLADLARAITIPRRVEFLAVTSYGDSEETTHSGAVRLLMDVRHPIESPDAHHLRSTEAGLNRLRQQREQALDHIGHLRDQSLA